MEGLGCRLKRSTEKELCGIKFIRIFINAGDKHTGRQHHGCGGMANFHVPATETAIMVGSVMRGNQGPYGRSGSLFLHLSEDGGGFTAQACSAALILRQEAGKGVGERYVFTNT